jgi:hypothetical protein
VRRIALAVTALTLVGCSNGSDVRQGVDRVCGPDADAAPCEEGVEAGVPYRFDLLTHCGIEWAYLDGRYWIAAPKIDPPSDWSPVESGTITLVNENEARFEGDSGGEASFGPAPVGYRPPPCA